VEHAEAGWQVGNLVVQVGVLDHDLKCMKDLVVEVTLTLDHVQPELGCFGMR